MKELIGLRRLDWRFLLPTPPTGGFQHLVLLGGTDDLSERLLDIGMADRVSRSLPQQGSADALVILHDARVAPDQAARCLRSGGVLYYEVDRRRPASFARTPGRLQRALRRVGVTPTGVYWVAPDFDDSKRLLPLHNPKVLRWFLSSLYIAATPLQRLLVAGAQIISRLAGQQCAWFAPCYSITAIAGPSQREAASVLRHPDLPEPLRQTDLSPLVLTSGLDDGSRVIMLPFAPTSTQPIAVLKMTRRPDFNPNTAREQATLKTIRSQITPALRPTIPEPLGVFDYNATIISAESYAKGHSLLVSSSRWGTRLSRKIDDLQLAASWLSAFHQQAQLSRSTWDGSAIQQWIEAPVEGYIQRFSATPGERQLFAYIRRRANSLAGSSLPIVWQHNDFGPWNLYRDNRRLSVIDWEFGREDDRDRHGPPLCDLLYFATYWSYLVRRIRNSTAEIRGFYELYIDPRCGGRTSLAAQRAIADYMRQLDVDQRFFPLLLIYTWVERALDYFDRKQTLGEIGEDVRSKNQYVKYIELLARHAGQLFAE